MSRARALVDRHIAAFNARDVDALLADFTDSASWITGDYVVPEGGMREIFTEAMQSLTPRLSLQRVIDGGDVVAVEVREAWSRDGSEKSAELVAVFDLEDGKVSQAKVYREGSADV